MQFIRKNKCICNFNGKLAGKIFEYLMITIFVLLYILDVLK